MGKERAVACVTIPVTLFGVHLQDASIGDSQLKQDAGIQPSYETVAVLSESESERFTRPYSEVDLGKYGSLLVDLGENTADTLKNKKESEQRTETAIESGIAAGDDPLGDRLKVGGEKQVAAAVGNDYDQNNAMQPNYQRDARTVDSSVRIASDDNLGKQESSANGPVDSSNESKAGSEEQHESVQNQALGV